MHRVARGWLSMRTRQTNEKRRPNRRRHLLFLGIGLLFLILSVPAKALAHERWFVKDLSRYPIHFELLFSWPVLAALVVSGGAVMTARFLDKRYRQRQRQQNPDFDNALLGIGEERLRRVYGYLPLLLAVHTAVPMLVSGFSLQLFAPNLAMRPNLLSGVLALAEVLIALALVYGVMTEIAALAMIGLFVAGMLLGPFTGIASFALLEHTEFIGIAVFLYIIGRGPFSGDALLGRSVHPNPNLVPYALPALRWGLGLSIVILAFTEKLLDPALAQAFLHQKIDFNIGSAFGLPDNLFVVLAGIGELTFGALLLSGFLPRLVIIAMWVPFNLTLPYLGWTELAGHLPIYAIMLTLLLVGPTSHRAAQRSAIILAEESGAIPRSESMESVTSGKALG